MKLVICAASTLLIGMSMGAAHPSYDGRAIGSPEGDVQFTATAGARRIGSNGPETDGLRAELPLTATGTARRIGSNGPDVDGLRIEIVNR